MGTIAEHGQAWDTAAVAVTTAKDALYRAHRGYLHTGTDVSYLDVRDAVRALDVAELAHAEARLVFYRRIFGRQEAREAAAVEAESLRIGVRT